MGSSRPSKQGIRVAHRRFGVHGQVQSVEEAAEHFGHLGQKDHSMGGQQDIRDAADAY